MRAVSLLVLVIALTRAQHQLYRFHNATIQGVPYSPPFFKGVAVIRDIHPASPATLDFGMGYSTITLGNTPNSAVKFGGIFGAGGVTQLTYNIALIRNREQFQSAFLGDAVDVASYMMEVGGSPWVQFLQVHSSMTTLDTLLVATVDATADTNTAAIPTFKNEAQQYLNERKFKKFVETYGTHYLREYTRGGKMVLVIKISSSRPEEKIRLDKWLGSHSLAGKSLTEAEFSTKLKNIRIMVMLKNFQSATRVHGYISGNTTPPPQGNIAALFQYVLDYSKNIQLTISEVEYTALWTVPGAPVRLKNYILQLQARTDTIVTIAVDLVNVENRALDFLSLRDSYLSRIPPAAWPKIEGVHRRIAEKRRELQNSYMTSRYWSPTTQKLDDIIEEYAGLAEELAVQLQEMLAAE